MFSSTKILELGSCAFRQPRAFHSHCRFIHGYKLSAKFWFEAKALDINNWVFDFGGLKGLKEILRKQFDHTTCIAADDPAMEVFEELVKQDACDLRVMPDGTGIERIAEWCFDAANAYVDEFTDGRCRCVKVEVFEHENNSAIFSSDVVKLEPSLMSQSLPKGAAYMNDRADEIEKSVNQMKRSKALEEPGQGKAFTEKKKKMEQVEENTKSDVTLPPFAKNKPAPIIQKKTKGWLDPNSTNSWGV